MNPQYTDVYLQDFYSRYQNSDNENHRYKDNEPLRISIHEKNLADIEVFSTKGKFLSIGCGGGHDLIAAKKRGWIPEGYEVESQFAAMLAEELAVPVQSGEFLDVPYKRDHYDCIYLNHVLEHPKDPSSYLKRCHKLLKQGGVLYIACPNIHSVAIKLKKAVEALGISSRPGKYYDSWQHLFYYSPATLIPVLEKYYGFRICLTGNDRKYKPGQSSLSHWWADYLASHLPYKSSFRIIAQKV
uniref:Class I SAM-dependent methyltransferase n=1 Tax=Roseihalotalea indica TaxID=2867963 RepID=A0AA49JEE7_9BACT|nr:class I SAM-dependent methyltransferase [Tunicatimonas sp. TK19036]